MGNETSVKTVGIGASAAVILMWLLGYYQPELMATAPTGLEAAFTGLFTTGFSYIVRAIQ